MNKANKLAAEVATHRSYFRSDKRWISQKPRTIAHVKRTIRRMERRVNKMLCMVEG